MSRFWKTIERFVKKRLPRRFKDALYAFMLRWFPIWVLKRIPFSYSGYLHGYQPKRGEVVIDGGAHIGNCALLFSRLVKPEGLVIALEPFDESFEILEKRLEKFNTTNVKAFKKALWDADQKVTLRVFSEPRQNRLAEEMADEVDGESAVRVDCITLDDLVRQLGLERLDVVKMDIEGAEIEALRGASETMKKYSPRFLIASYHIRDGQKTYIEVERILAANGYTVQTIFPPHLTTYGYREPRSADVD